MPQLDWVRLTDSKGRTYYYNTRNSTSQWEAPPDFREPTPRTVKAVQAKGIIGPDQPQQNGLKRTFTAEHTTSTSSQSTSGSSSSGGGSLLRTVQSLAGFSGRSSKLQTTSRAQQRSWGLTSGGGDAKKAPSPTNAAASAAAINGMDDRRCWGRPDRLRTESGEDLLAAVDPAYRFRTSSSADLIALLSLTRGASLEKKVTGSSAKDQLSLKRPPSFMEMDLISGKVPANIVRPVRQGKGRMASLSEEESPERVRRPRRNTTNSVMIDNLMSKPDPQVQIRCVASLLHAQMVRFALAHARTKVPVVTLPRFAVFNDDYGKEVQTTDAKQQVNSASASAIEDASKSLKRIPSTHTANSLERQLLTRNMSQQTGLKRSDSKVDVFDQGSAPKVPDKEKIAQFVETIFSKAQMESETIIMLLVYVERLLEATKGKLELTMRNWRPVVLACMVLASKVWDDLSMWNADFSLISGAFTVKRINELEIALLEAMQYNVRVPASTYAKYYFQLRALRTQLGEKLPETSEPLSIEKASKWEVLSERYQDALGVGWVGPAAKKASNGGGAPSEAKKEGKDGKDSKKSKRPTQGPGIRLRSATLYEGAARSVIEQMHASGPKFAPNKHSPNVSVEQVVSLKHLGPMKDNF